MPPTQISQAVTTGRIPAGSAGSAAGQDAQQSATIQADPRQEYIAGGPLWLSRDPRALTHAIDDLTLAFGPDLYERMCLDSGCISALNILRSSILEDGIHLVAVIDDKENEDYEQAQKIHDFCEDVLSDLTCDLSAVLWDMLEALGTGYRVAELVYEDESTYTGRQQIALRRINPKPNNASAFVVDAQRNVLGLLGLIPGNALSFTGFGSVITDLADQANLLPREKFAVLTCRPHDNDPRGTSVLRPAYTYWRMKSDLWPEYEKYLVQFASPVPAGFAGPDAQATPERDSSGAVVTYPDGSPRMVTPQQAILSALLGYRNGAALAFPHGADVKTLFPAGDGAAFGRAFDLLDKQIAIAILHQTLAQGSGQQAHSRAASQVHERVTATIVAQAKLSVQWMFRRDVLRQLVRYNFGEGAARLTPEVSLGATEQQDFAANVTALATAGYTLDQSQFAEVDTSLGLPEREPPPAQDTVPGAAAPVPPSPGAAAQPDGTTAAPPSVTAAARMSNGRRTVSARPAPNSAQAIQRAYEEWAQADDAGYQ